MQPEAPEGSSDYTRAQFDKDGYFITVDYAGDTTDPSTAKMVSFSYAQGDQSDFLSHPDRTGVAAGLDRS